MNHSSSIGTAPPAADIEAFVTRWRGSTASELSTAQSFTIELCELLGVPRPHATAEQDYMFERPLTLMHGDGTSSARRIDCYRRGCFVLESKKLDPGAQAATTGRTRKSFDNGLLQALSQAEGYVRALPAAEGRPPFIAVVDVGHVIELYAEFSRSGGAYTPYPDVRTHRIRLDDLHRPEIRERLRALWLDPMSLDPSRVSARVTRAVSAELAELARSLEQAGHPAEQVAAFLTRCLFSMFAEDVGLLPRDDDGRGAFVGLLTRWRDEPPRLGKMLQALWATMDSGGFSPVLAQDLMRFNGKLFKGASASGYGRITHGAEEAFRLGCLAIQGSVERLQAGVVQGAVEGGKSHEFLVPDESFAVGVFIDRLAIGGADLLLHAGRQGGTTVLLPENLAGGAVEDGVSPVCGHVGDGIEFGAQADSAVLIGLVLASQHAHLLGNRCAILRGCLVVLLVELFDALRRAVSDALAFHFDGGALLI